MSNWERQVWCLFGLGVALVLSLSCSAESPQIASTQANPLRMGAGGLMMSGPPEGGAVPVVAAGVNGSSCALNNQCDSGACVNGFCCESECDGVCVSCAEPGQEGSCRATASDDICPALQCPQSTECLQYVDAQAGANCLGAGQCQTEAECLAQPASAETVCGLGGAGLCDGLGVCVVPNKASLGEGCSENDDCAEGNCVQGADGVGLCCDSACDGLCQACSAVGRCDAVASTDSRCEAAECPADNACRVYPQLAPGRCAAFGVCQGQEACFAQAQQLRPDTQCRCAEDGSCEFRVGTSCENDEQCGANSCEQTSGGTKVCCAESCVGGEFCAGDASACIECEGNDVTCDGNRETRCQAGQRQTADCVNGCSEGSGCNAQAPIGFLCETAQCQQGGLCQQDTSGVRRCCSRDCQAEGRVCGSDGSCQCPAGQTVTGDGCLRQVGDPCDGNGQCQGNRCVDGVCCAEACDGLCEQCQLGSGSCVAIAAEQQDSDPQTACNNTRECMGVRGDCRVRLRESCNEINQGSDCVSGSCVDSGNGAAICCLSDCGGATPVCDSRTGQCVECTGSDQCENGCDLSQLTCNACPDGEEVGAENACVDIAPPVVSSSQVRGVATSLFTVELLIPNATDNRTPVGQLQYAVIHSMGDVFQGLSAQEAFDVGNVNGFIGQFRVVVRRSFAVLQAIGTIPVPEKAPFQYFLVVVRDEAGNMAAYDPTVIDFRSQQAASCTIDSQCLSSCQDGACLPF